MAAPALTPRTAAREGVREGGGAEEGPERERPEQAGALAGLLIAIAALTGGMFLSGHPRPHLRHRASPAARASRSRRRTSRASRKAINQTNMNTAVDIMNRRVNGLGVSEAEVQTPGINIIDVQGHELQGSPGTGRHHREALLPSGPGHRGLRFGRVGQPVAQRLEQLLLEGHGQGHRKGDLVELREPDGLRRVQGRAVADALKASSTPSASSSASSSASPSASSSASPSASSSASASAAATKLQAQYTALDCTDKAQRARAGEGSKASDPTVACGKNSSGQWQKYVLGPAEVGART